MQHRHLADQIERANDGSLPHLARLQAELVAAKEAGAAQHSALQEQQRQLGLLHAELELREKQLAILLSHVESEDSEKGSVSTEKRYVVTSTMRDLRSRIKLRESQLVSLVKDLYLLAGKEKTSGSTSHDLRSRLYSQCAAIFESLGADAFATE